MSYKEFSPFRVQLLGLALGLVAVAGAARAGEIRDLRLVTAESSTQLVVELSGPAAHKLFTLGNPNRVVLDLAGTTLPARIALPPAVGIVTGVRAGKQPNNTVRLVFDMSKSVRPRVLESGPNGPYPFRLIVSLDGSGATTATTATNAAVAAGAAVATAPVVPHAIQPVHAPSESGRDIVIAVDAGHGGVDPGAIGPSKTREKDVVLQIAQALVAKINAEPGMRGVLTRDGDYFLELRDRMLRARRAKADMFVSIHADSIGNPSVSGSSVYVLSERGASSEAARWLAERENAADLKGGVSLEGRDKVLANVLLDLSQSASISQSMAAAEQVLRSLDGVGEVRKPRVQQAGFVVLKSPDIPSLLVETAYISNKADESKLRQPAHRARIADAIFGGIQDYFNDNAPDGTRLAAARRSRVADATSGGRL
ncbi:MAG: N-acetylmuramoyl-L-alanine amidase [Pseudomonadales bacterium]|nr:N-acetylmuramoyl-L-alanine amidase [Pseudomonadales bacterium]